MRRFYPVIISMIITLAIAGRVYGQSVSYDPGNGMHLKSADNKFDFLFSGYINTIFSYHNEKQNGAIQNSFSVHRARLDMGFDFDRKYGAFFEFETAGQRTAMVLAQVQMLLFTNNYIMAGKFIDPFSAENNRSTSRLTTIERYSGLNSVFLLPGVDTQYGIMFFGHSNSSNFNYYLSVTNGNGSAGQNIAENNNSKNVTARLSYNAGENLSFGGSLSFAKEQPQVLSLLDHTFESFNSTNISGNRIGYLANFEYNKNQFLFRGEAFRYNFTDGLSIQNQVNDFTGAYFELGYFLSGDSRDGFQLIGRFETARFGNTINNFTGPANINSFILGTNWLLENIISFQVNLVYEKADSKSVIPSTRLTGKDSEVILLTTFQFRF